MCKQLITFAFLFFLRSNPTVSQDLLGVDWNKTVCTDYYIDQVCKTIADDDGYIYTLGSFPYSAGFLDENLNENEGSFFILKQNSSGDKIWIMNLGDTTYYATSDMELCKNGDLVLGLNFRNNFIFNSDIIATSKDWTSIILRLDSNCNLKWFKTYPAKWATMINKLIVDDNDNTYASIHFIDSLNVNGTIYSNARCTCYSSVVLKLDPYGNLKWNHLYSSDNLVGIGDLSFYNSCNSCPNSLLLIGGLHADSLFIDGNLQLLKNSIYYNQYFVSIINEFGDLLTVKLLPPNIMSITNVVEYGEHTYFSGKFIDTIRWNNYLTIAHSSSAIFIGELDQTGKIIGFTEIEGSTNIGVSDFHVSPTFGFVLSGAFDGRMVIQNDSVVLASQYDVGSFIVNLNENLKLMDFKYVKGGSFIIRNLSIHNNEIIGAALFEENCYFQNESCFSWNDDVSVFKTTDLYNLSEFNPDTFPPPNDTFPPIINETNFAVIVCPNPFGRELKMEFTEPIYSTSLTFTNVLGQLSKNIYVYKINDTEVTIDASRLSSGLYIVHYRTCNNFEGTVKLIKVDE